MLKINFRRTIMIHNRHRVIDESSIGILLKRVNGNVFVIPTDVCNLSSPTASDQALEVLFVYTGDLCFRTMPTKNSIPYVHLKTRGTREERPPKLNWDRQILLIMRRLLLLYYDVSLRKSLHVNTGSLGEKERKGTLMGIMILYICRSNNQLIYTAVVVSPGETVICFDLFF